MLNIKSILIILSLITHCFVGSAQANNEGKLAEKTSVKDNYVTDCRSGSCAITRAAQWSMLDENRHAVAIAVRMGTKTPVSDAKIKNFLADGFKHYGVENVKFFFEQNDTAGTGITFHVRGGTDGLFTLNQGDEIKEAVARSARMSKIELF